MWSQKKVKQNKHSILKWFYMVCSLFYMVCSLLLGSVVIVNMLCHINYYSVTDWFVVVALMVGCTVGLSLAREQDEEHKRRKSEREKWEDVEITKREIDDYQKRVEDRYFRQMACMNQRKDDTDE